MVKSIYEGSFIINRKMPVKSAFFMLSTKFLHLFIPWLVIHFSTNSQVCHSTNTAPWNRYPLGRNFRQGFVVSAHGQQALQSKRFSFSLKKCVIQYINCLVKSIYEIFSYKMISWLWISSRQVRMDVSMSSNLALFLGCNGATKSHHWWLCQEKSHRTLESLRRRWQLNPAWVLASSHYASYDNEWV